MGGTRLARLDAELVRRGLARSRQHAAELITGGSVRVGGTLATRAATQVERGAPVTVRAPQVPDYASRGGHKLAAALTAFPGVSVSGRHCLDAGASTGGFTDVLLRAGADSVIAADVGYGQLAWNLRSDPRVRVLDRTNVRALQPGDLGGQVDLTVADLSFIGLAVVLPALTACTRDDGDLVVLVKPQFEVGRERLGPGGVVRDPLLRALAVRDVAAAARTLHWHPRGVVASPLPGPAGNVEYVLWLRRDPDTSPADTSPADTSPADTSPPDTSPPDTSPPGTWMDEAQFGDLVDRVVAAGPGPLPPVLPPRPPSGTTPAGEAGTVDGRPVFPGATAAPESPEPG